MDAAAAVEAQAKINLFLHVHAREESGYHQIETLFCRLALADDIVVRVRPSGESLDCAGTETGPAEQNLAFRAARAYAHARGWPRGFAIELNKRIPVGAGLGGGSADAGAVLRALYALDPDPPPSANLLAWATDLGADVPAMTLESPLALGWARGDRLLTLPALPPRPVMLYVPAAPVSTADAYAWLAAARKSAGGYHVSARALEYQSLTNWDTVIPLMANDFSSAVGGRYPEIATMTDRMGAVSGAVALLMSGSGSVVFGIFSARIPDPWPLAPAEGGRFMRQPRPTPLSGSAASSSFSRRCPRDLWVRAAGRAVGACPFVQWQDTRLWIWEWWFESTRGNYGRRCSSPTRIQASGWVGQPPPRRRDCRLPGRRAVQGHDIPVRGRRAVRAHQ